MSENNLSLQQRLYDLRSKTKDAFDEAKRLEIRWKVVEKEQKEVYQVGIHVVFFGNLSYHHPFSLSLSTTRDSTHNFSYCAFVTASQLKTKHPTHWRRLLFNRLRSRTKADSQRSDKTSMNSFETSRNRGGSITSEPYGLRSGPTSRSFGETTDASDSLL